LDTTSLSGAVDQRLEANNEEEEPIEAEENLEVTRGLETI